MEFGILGPLRVSAGGDAVKLGGPLQRGLLAELLVTPNAAVTDDQLIEELWGDRPPPSARHLLEVYVSRLRTALGDRADGARRIERSAAGYVLRLESAELDASRFLAATADGHRLADSEPSAAERSLESALRLWRGAPFADIVDPPSAVREHTEYLERERRAATQAWAAVGLRLGRHQRLVPELTRLVAGQPYDEALCASLMLALYRSGRQADALEAGRSLRARLRQDLGVDPSPELTALYRQILLQDPCLALEPPEPPSSLPQPLTSFVGRAAELTSVAGLLATGRMVTLTGPAGVGKTRLAIEAAQRARRGFPDGVVWVDLAGTTGPDGVEPSTASAVGVGGTGGDLRRAITGALARRRALLVLDNCEAVASTVGALVADILRACPGLRVLATSRVPLQLEGERRWVVPPLSLPVVDGTMAEVETSDAVRLFLERGRAVNADLSPDSRTLSEVADACRRLDGLPLAIEMAAARLHVLTPAEIVAGLGARFELLTLPGRARATRHGALEVAIESSHAALPAHEQAAFNRMAVFSGSFDLAAAAAVAVRPPGHDALEVVTDLVDASMVATEQAGGATRYRLLETLRDFAAARLRTSGSEQDSRAAHARHYLEMAAAAGADVDTPAFAAWVGRLARDEVELYAALDWSLQHEPRQATLIAVPALNEFWYRRGEARQAGLWSARMLAGDLDGVSPALLGQVHCAAGFAGILSLDLASADLHLEAASRLARASGQTGRLVFALSGRAAAALAAGDFESVRLRAREGLEAAASIAGDGGRWARALPLSQLGYAALFGGGSAAEARDRFAESAALFRELGDRGSLVIMALVPLVGLLRDGNVAGAEQIGAEAIEAAAGTAWEAAALTSYAWALHATGDVVGAEQAARRGLRIALDSGLDQWIGNSLHELAQCAAGTDRLARAVRLVGASRRYISGASGDPRTFAAFENRCRDAVGSDVFERLVSEGAALDAAGIDALASAG